MATVGGIDIGQIESRGQIGGAVGDDDGVALGELADVHRKTHRAILGDHAEVAGDDARGLNGFEAGGGGKDDGNAERLNDGRIEERHGQLLEIVGQGQQIASMSR